MSRNSGSVCIRLKVVGPSMTGIITSSRTTSARRWRRDARAAASQDSDATTSQPAMTSSASA